MRFFFAFSLKIFSPAISLSHSRAIFFVLLQRWSYSCDSNCSLCYIKIDLFNCWPAGWQPNFLFYIFGLVCSTLKPIVFYTQHWLNVSCLMHTNSFVKFHRLGKFVQNLDHMAKILIVVTSRCSIIDAVTRCKIQNVRRWFICTMKKRELKQNKHEQSKMRC